MEESPGIAEVFLPLQTMNISSICLHPPVSVYPVRIPTVHISYKNSIFTLPNLAIFTPFLIVKSWDAIKGRLELCDGGGDSFTKLQALHESILKILVLNPSWSSVSAISYTELKSKFQPLIANKVLRLYLTNQDLDGITVYSKDSVVKGVSDKSFQPKQQLRIALRLQGIVLLKNSNSSLFYRLQHQVASIYTKI
jgi:aspartate carbamoyltransferase regulatory subunit